MERKRVSYAKYGYLFSLPFVITFLVCMLYPIGYTTYIGFTDLMGAAPPEKISILADPWKNFKDIWGAPTFQTALKNTIKIWVVNFIPQMLLALLLAAWFTNNHRKVKGQGFFKVVFYMPSIITAATVAILFNALFAYPKGPANDFLLSMGFREEPFYFANSGLASWLTVSFIQFWQWYGNTMIVLIAGILGISPDLYEAAEIDGANGWDKFFRVTIPNLKTILLYTLVTSLIGGLTMFDIPKMYLNGQPNNATLTTSVFIFEQAYGNSYMYNRGAAASMIMFVLISICSAILFFVMRDKDEIELHKLQKQQEKKYRRQIKEERRLMQEGKL